MGCACSISLGPLSVVACPPHNLDNRTHVENETRINATLSDAVLCPPCNDSLACPSCGEDSSSDTYDSRCGRSVYAGSRQPIHHPVWLDAYKRIYAREVSKRKAGKKYRVVVSRPHTTFYGFGNQYRAVQQAAVYALLTGRLLLIDSPIYREQFLEPYPSLRFSFTNSDQASFGKLRMTSISTSQFLPENATIDRTSVPAIRRITEVENFDVVVVTGGTDTSGYLLEYYLREALTIFHGQIFQLDLNEMVLGFFLQCPKPELTRDVDKMLSRVTSSSFPELLVPFQVRFVYNEYSDIREEAQYWWNLTLEEFRTVRLEDVGDRSVTFYVQSDKPLIIPEIAQYLRRFGLVLRDDTFQVLKTSDLYKYKRGGEYVQRQSVLDWYILGLGEYALCSVTTFCYTARAMWKEGLRNTFRIGLGLDHRVGRLSYPSDLNDGGMRASDINWSWFPSPKPGPPTSEMDVEVENNATLLRRKLLFQRMQMSEDAEEEENLRTP